jgi:predicted metal-dependent hydrolase
VPRVKMLAQTNGFTYKSIRINSAVTRWGSCGPSNTLNFSWRLLAAPPDVIDSVILHELVHTEIKNHSSRFYTKLASVKPDYKESEKWLKNNSGILIF